VSHGPVHLVIDSTGLKLFGRASGTRRSIASVLTSNDLDDAGQTPVLLEQVDADICEYHG
jgi:hypothetical protein